MELRESKATHDDSLIYDGAAKENAQVLMVWNRITWPKHKVITDE